MNTILCYASNEMADFEVVLTLQLLRAKGRKDIVPVGIDLSPVVGQSGLTLQPRATLAQALNLPDVEALIIPGGPIRPQPDGLTPLIQKIDREKKLLAAICFGPQYLGRAGILNHHQFTTSCSEDKIKSMQVPDPYPRHNYVEARIICDGNVITAQGSAFVDFAYAVADYLDAFSGHREERDRLYREMMNR